MIFTSRLSLACFTSLISLMPVKADVSGNNQPTNPKRHENAYTLPGVKPAKPIVTSPQAEPDNGQRTMYPDGSFMVGNTRVKISGSVIVDIGTDKVGQK